MLDRSKNLEPGWQVEAEKSRYRGRIRRKTESNILQKMILLSGQRDDCTGRVVVGRGHCVQERSFERDALRMLIEPRPRLELPQSSQQITTRVDTYSKERRTI
jgi:hypothetical protein